MSKESKITQYSGIAAKNTAAALNPGATDQQVQQASNNARAADRQVERLRTGHIE